MEKKEFVFDGINCSYIVSKNNNNPCILLAHGYCSDRRVWDDIVPELSKHFFLIVPDLIGYGESQLGDNYSMDYLSDYIHSIIKIEKIDRFHFVGHSMGGYIGLEYLEKNSNKLFGLSLLNSHCFTDSDERTTNREKTISFLAKHGSNIYINEIYKNLFSKPFYEKNAILINDLKERAKKYKVETLIQSCRGMIDRKDHSKTLKNCKIPIQFILGKEDSLIPLLEYIKQASYPNISEINLIENMGHMGMLENPEATQEHISSFSNWAIAKI